MDRRTWCLQFLSAYIGSPCMTSNVYAMNTCAYYWLLLLSVIASQELLRSNQSLFFGLSSSAPLNVPILTVERVTNLTVEYHVQRNDTIANAPLIAGYEVTRFGVPMIGEYVNAGRGRRVTISPAVPSAQYRITAWALGAGRRSATPAVKNVTTGEAGELNEHSAHSCNYHSLH